MARYSGQWKGGEKGIMATAPKTVAEDTQAIIDAWDELAPTATFAGMTLVQFRPQCNPRSIRVTRSPDPERSGSGTVSHRGKVDVTTLQTNSDVVKSVVADKNFGDDSALYERMGYVRKSVLASVTHPQQPPPRQEQAPK